MPEAILFANANFHGRHKHVFGPEPNLNAGDDSFFNDRVSSIAILDGAWQCYRNAGFNAAYPAILGPGLYSFIPAVGIENDNLSSLRPVAGSPTTHGTPIGGEVILFEKANFHGRHKHVLAPETKLHASDDNFFNDRVSSVVVQRGVWKFYRDAGFNSPYPPRLGTAQRLGIPGLYPSVADVQIQNDAISSLQPVALPPTLNGVTTVIGHAIIFENANFRGQHKHVFIGEPNLKAADDHFFNDGVSSLVIQQAVWAFYRTSGFNFQYPRMLEPGLYSLVKNFDIQNNNMSSLQPL